MTKDQEQTLLTCKFSDIPKLFPDHPMRELLRLRKKLQNARHRIRYCQRNYNADDPVFNDDWMTDAREGSARLLDAIRRATA